MSSLLVSSSAPAPVPASVTGVRRPPISESRGDVVLDVVVPVHDEEVDLERCVRRLHTFLTTGLPYPFRITIADNASTDGTWAIAKTLQAVLPHVVAVHLDAKGRGRALACTWSASTAPVLAYMDVDLSTDLAALLPLVAPLVSGHSDIAIGSRLANGSHVVRGPRREVISRCYNLLLRRSLGVRFSDAQCGFKAIRKDVAEQLLPLVVDTGWFFDTELLVLAERAGARISEVAVDWVDDPDSRVDILSTAWADVRGIARLSRAMATGRVPLAALRAELDRGGRSVVARAAGTVDDDPGARRARSTLAGLPVGLVGQMARFGAIGLASTLAYLVLYLVLRAGLGAQVANVAALLVTAVANTAANRRLTFGVRGRDGAARSQLQGLLVFAAALALTSLSLTGLHAASDHPARWVEVSVLVVANAVATALRFLALRAWVFRGRR